MAGNLANFGGKRAAPFGSNGRKQASTKTASGEYKKGGLAQARKRRKRAGIGY